MSSVMTLGSSTSTLLIVLLLVVAVVVSSSSAFPIIPHPHHDEAKLCRRPLHQADEQAPLPSRAQQQQRNGALAFQQAMLSALKPSDATVDLEQQQQQQQQQSADAHSAFLSDSSNNISSTTTLVPPSSTSPSPPWTFPPSSPCAQDVMQLAVSGNLLAMWLGVPQHDGSSAYCVEIPTNKWCNIFLHIMCVSPTNPAHVQEITPDPCPLWPRPGVPATGVCVNDTCSEDLLTQMLVNASTQTIGLDLVIQMSYRMLCNLTAGHDCDVNKSYVSLSAECFTKQDFEAGNFGTPEARAAVGIFSFIICLALACSIGLFFMRRATTKRAAALLKHQEHDAQHQQHLHHHHHHHHQTNSDNNKKLQNSLSPSSGVELRDHEEPLIPAGEESIQGSGNAEEEEQQQEEEVSFAEAYPKLMTVLQAFDLYESISNMVSAKRFDTVKRGGEKASPPTSPATAAKKKKKDAAEHYATDWMSGWRFLAMITVVYGHCAYFPLLATDFVNDTAVRDFMKSYASIMIYPAILAVDVFFFMSGFLGFHLMVINFEKHKLVTFKTRNGGATTSSSAAAVVAPLAAAADAASPNNEEIPGTMSPTAGDAATQQQQQHQPPPRSPRRTPFLAQSKEQQLLKELQAKKQKQTATTNNNKAAPPAVVVADANNDNVDSSDRATAGSYEPTVVRGTHNLQRSSDASQSDGGSIVLLNASSNGSTTAAAAAAAANTNANTNANADDLYSDVASRQSDLLDGKDSHQQQQEEEEGALQIHYKKFAVDLLMLYLHRYLRLTPLMVTGYVIYVYVMPSTIHGPFKHVYTEYAMYKLCNADSWWHMLLYMQSWNIDFAGCAGWFWFLSTDFNLFLFQPWIGLLYMISPRYSVIMLLAMMTVSVGLALHFNPIGDEAKYSKPYLRMAPYIFGILGAITIRQKWIARAIHASWKLRWTIYGVSLALLVGTINYSWYFSYRLYAGEGRPEWLILTCNFAYAVFWGLGLAGFAVCWSLGHGGVVAEWLSNSFFAVLSKLTFGCYIVHPIIIMTHISDLTAVPTFVQRWLYMLWAGVVAWSFGSATILYIFIEYPSAMLIKLLAPSKREGSKTDTHTHNG